jgi:hypothetical protein
MIRRYSWVAGQMGMRAPGSRWSGWSLVAALLGSAGCGEPIGEDSLEVELQPFSICGDFCSSWVFPSSFDLSSGIPVPTRPLIYVPDHEGDRIADFGRVGYMQGRYGLPSETLPSQGSGNACPTSQPRTAACTATNAYVLQAPPSGVPASLPALVAPGNDPCAVNGAGAGQHNHGPWIQAVLDMLGDPSVPGPVRGRLYLSRGHYAIWNRLDIPDGVVLRGVSENDVSSSQPATTLHACGRSASALITVDAPSSGTLASNGPLVQDEIVPSGSNSVTVNGAGWPGLVPGVQVRITRFSPQGWLDEIGMTDLWEESTKNLELDRTITHVETVDDVPFGKRLFFDQPLTTAIESKYGGANAEVVQFLTPITRTSNVGVYRLKGVSHQAGGWCPGGLTLKCNGQAVNYWNTTCSATDEVICSNPAHQAKCFDANNNVVAIDVNDSDEPLPYCRHSKYLVDMNRAENSWVLEAVAKGFSKSAVLLRQPARYNTVEKVTYVEPLSRAVAPWRYSFWNDGEFNLVADCDADEGRHDFVTGQLSSGPNVFFDSDSTASLQDSGPHHRWSVGTLFDNVSMTSNSELVAGGELNVRNRYEAGSGHGWTGSSMVVWNSMADRFRYFNPPTGQNWLIGSVGSLGTPNDCLSTNYPDCDDGEIAPGLLESPPHFDFYDDGYHGEPAGALGTDSLRAHSLYRSAARIWLDYPNGLQQREYFAGDADDFGTAGVGADTNDEIFVNPAFKSYVETLLLPSSRGFDSTDDHKNIPFTFRFDLGANDVIVHAYLTLRMKRPGSYNVDSDHRIMLATADADGSGFANDLTSYYFLCTATPCGGTAISSTLTGPLGFTGTATPSVRVVDLKNLLSGLGAKKITQAGRTFGELNVNFYRRTRIDWASLSLVIKKG